MPLDSTTVAIYVNDHLAGAALVTDLVRRRRESDMDDPDEWEAQFLAELEQEQEVLRAFLDRMGSARNPLKSAAGWVAEKASGIKRALDGVVDEDLRHLLEYEHFKTGVEGKECLWRALLAVRHADPDAVPELDLEGLLEQAERQANEIERRRVGYAVAALRQARPAGTP